MGGALRKNGGIVIDWLDQFKNPATAKRTIKAIKDLAPDKKLKFCHVCGTHEATITRYGLRDLLPSNIEVISGPGCPVCITPAREIDEAVWLAENDVTIATFGDMFRVPGTIKSLSNAKAEGGDVRIVYSASDALELARNNPDLDVVFFAIGFETTAPTTAATILSDTPANFGLLVSHRLIPPAMELMMGLDDVQLDGFICPGHVSTIIGLNPYKVFPEFYNMPTVIAGFEPVDVLMTIFLLLKQIKENSSKLENEYSRSVKPEGNKKALKIMHETYQITSGHWRGIGRVPNSALKLKNNYREFDAREKYDIKLEIDKGKELPSGCSCHLIIVGRAYPPECPLYMKTCRPDHPIGACMVSSEGACNIWSRYGGVYET